MILEAPTLSGPFSIISMLPSFAAQAYFVSMPSAWLDADGGGGVLAFSANYVRQSCFSLCAPLPLLTLASIAALRERRLRSEHQRRGLRCHAASHQVCQEDGAQDGGRSRAQGRGLARRAGLGRSGAAVRDQPERVRRALPRAAGLRGRLVVRPGQRSGELMLSLMTTLLAMPLTIVLTMMLLLLLLSR